jgi:outer membrane receptor protein involved in Fe transport
MDDMTWVKARHIVKFGVEIRRINMNQGNSQSGTLTYLSLNNLMTNSMDGATYTSLLPLKRMRKTQAYEYVHDEYKVTPNLTVNMGLRYSFFNVFHEVDNRAIPFDFATCGGYCSRGSVFSYRRRDDLDPRPGDRLGPRQDRSARRRRNVPQRRARGRPKSPYRERLLALHLVPGDLAGLSYPIDWFLANANGIVTPRDVSAKTSMS